MPTSTKCRDRFPGDAPFGADVKYDPVFENLKAEVLKLTAHSSLEGGVDWKSVKAWSLDILISKSKDLTVASYLTLALFVLDGYGGLSDGLGILQKYIQDDWDGVFPRRRPARATGCSTLEWLVTRLPPFIETKAPEPFEVALLAPLREELSAFQEGVRQRLMHETPSFSDLNAALAAYRRISRTPRRPAVRISRRPRMPAARTRLRAGRGPPRRAGRRRRAWHAGRRDRGPHPRPDPGAARGRAAVAGPLPPAPLAEVGRHRRTPPSSIPTPRPPAPRASSRRARSSGRRWRPCYAAGNWSALLNRQRGQPSRKGWAPSGSTSSATRPRRSTSSAAPGRRKPSRTRPPASWPPRVLPTFYFAERTVTDPKRPAERTIERTPFASEETRQWMETLKSAKGGGEAPAVLLPAPRAVETAEPSLSPADARTVQELLSRQQSAAAFDVLQAAVDKAPNQRARFRTRLTAARLCLQANQAAWARALLETLLTESETFQFEDWEPETASDLYQLLALCYAKPAKKGGPQDPEAARVQIENLRRKLFRLDMRAAAGLEEALKR